LPDLTWFTGRRRCGTRAISTARGEPTRRPRPSRGDSASLERIASDRAPLPPRLARSTTIVACARSAQRQPEAPLPDRALAAAEVELGGDLDLHPAAAGAPQRAHRRRVELEADLLRPRARERPLRGPGAGDPQLRRARDVRLRARDRQRGGNLESAG